MLPPSSEQVLWQRALALSGYRVHELAAQAKWPLPASSRHAKGFVGQLLEWHLGATAGSAPTPDFLALGIELKSIPVSSQGKVLESTFVTLAPLTNNTGVRWEDSTVKHKLGCVLWIPVLSDPALALGERQIGHPVLWRPSAAEERLLAQDWEDIMEGIALGRVQQLSAYHGQVLQLRPKGANRQSVTPAIDAQGQQVWAQPRGFYLKTQFTAAVLRRCLSG